MYTESHVIQRKLRNVQHWEGDPASGAKTMQKMFKKISVKRGMGKIPTDCNGKINRKEQKSLGFMRRWIKVNMGSPASLMYIYITEIIGVYEKMN